MSSTATDDRDDKFYESYIREIQLDNGTIKRQGKILALLGLTGLDDDQGLRERSIYTAVSAFLAFRELQMRSGAILTNLPKLLEQCNDMEWVYEARDTRFESLQAARSFVAATDMSSTNEPPKQSSETTPPENPNNQILNNTHSRKRNLRQIFNSSKDSSKEESLLPFGMIGAYSSRVSKMLSILGDALSMPQISGSATSVDLTYSPLFARTTATDDGQVQAFVSYLQHLGVKHAANIYSKDSYGTQLFQSFQQAANAVGIKVRGISYNVGNEQRALEQLMESQYHYVYCTIVSGLEQIIEAAWQQQVMGRGSTYAWFFSEKYFLTYESFAYRKESTDDIMAYAFEGLGLVNVYEQSHTGLQQALVDFSTNPVLQQEFISKHRDMDLSLFQNFSYPTPISHFNQNMYFDAVIAMGLASCRTPGLFSGQELYQQLLELEFEGVTGNISFDKFGNRAISGLKYRIDNLQVSEERSDDVYYRFNSTLSAIIEGGPGSKKEENHAGDESIDGTTSTVGANGSVTVLSPFLFPGEKGVSEKITLDLPATVDYDWNYIPSWAQGIGYAIALSIVVLSIAIIVWTWIRRETHVVKAAQPPFLVQVCVGTLIMACAIFPMYFHGGGEDELQNPWKYDAACISSMWCLFLGFVTSFSAILAKTWRVNKLMHAGKHIHRIEIRPRDAMWPFVVLMSINVVMLSGLSFIFPLEYVRRPIRDYDEFGRSIESYGTCQLSSGMSYTFLVPLVVANTCGIALAGWQCYKARHLPVDFAETYYLGLGMASLVESVVLSLPVLIAIRGQTTSYFLFGCVAICLLCLGILVPVFLPKYVARNETSGVRNAASLLATTNRMPSVQVQASGDHGQSSILMARTLPATSGHLANDLSMEANHFSSALEVPIHRPKRVMGRMAIKRKR